MLEIIILILVAILIYVIGYNHGRGERELKQKARGRRQPGEDVRGSPSLTMEAVPLDPRWAAFKEEEARLTRAMSRLWLLALASWAVCGLSVLLLESGHDWAGGVMCVAMLPAFGAPFAAMEADGRRDKLRKSMLPRSADS